MTIDDVLDYLLPEDWRSHDDDDPVNATRAVHDDRQHPHRERKEGQEWHDGTCKTGLDAPKGAAEAAHAVLRAPVESSDRFGRFTEWIARAMGTPWFLLRPDGLRHRLDAWNTLAPAKRGASTRPRSASSR